MKRFVCILTLLFCVVLAQGRALGDGNLVKNPGFEADLQGWASGWRKDLVKPAIDNAVMHGPGQGSLVLRCEADKAGGWVLQNVGDLPAGAKKYRVSGWIKMKGLPPAWQGMISVEQIGAGGKWLGITLMATPWDQSAGDVDWQKLSKEFDLKDGTEALRISLMVRKSLGWDAKAVPSTGTVWYDDISLERVSEAVSGTAPAVVAPRTAAAPGGLKVQSVALPAKFGMIYAGQPAEFAIKLTDAGTRERRLTATITVKDFYDRVIFSRNDGLSIGSASGYDYRFTVPGQKNQGFYGVNLVLKENGLPLLESTHSFCVVAPAEKRDPFFGFSCFGPSEPERCRLMNAGTIGLSVHWNQIEKKKGVFDFTSTDEKLRKWTEEGFSPVGMIYTPFDDRQFNIPGWLWNDVKKWRTDTGEHFTPDYFDLWDRYVRAIVKRYKGRIKVWSLIGEYDGLTYLIGLPGKVSSKDYFVRLTRVIATAIKETDPDCIVGGVGVSGVDSQGGLKVARSYWSEVGDVLDGMHFDPYVEPHGFGPGSSPIGEERGGLRQILLDALKIVGTSGKKRIAIDEKGYRIDSNLPVDSPYAKEQAKVAARGLIIAKSVPEVSHYLYFMVYSSWEPDPPLRSDYYIWKKEGPRPTAAAYAATARILAGAVEPVEISIHKDILIYVFRQGSKSIAALWTVLPEKVSLLANLPGKSECFDMMGNTTALLPAGRRELILTDAPLYLSSSASPQQLAEALRKGVFSLPLVKAEATLSGRNSLDIHIANQTDRALLAKIEPLPINGSGWRQASSGAVAVPARGVAIVPLYLQKGDFFGQTGKKDFQAGITVEGRKTTLGKFLDPYRVPLLRKPAKVDGSLDEYSALPAIVLDSAENVFPSGMDLAGRLWLGLDDLSLKAWLTYDDQYLYFAAEVRDDALVQERTGTMIWAGDGFALGIDTLNDALPSEVSGVSGYDGNDYDLGIALTSQGPQSYMWVAAAVNEKLKGDLTGRLKLAIIPSSSPGKWNYELAIPWEYMKPLSGRSGSAFGFNFAYMDIDAPGGGYSYWMALTPGIIGGKDPARFKTFILE